MFDSLQGPSFSLWSKTTQFIFVFGKKYNCGFPLKIEAETIMVWCCFVFSFISARFVTFLAWEGLQKQTGKKCIYKMINTKIQFNQAKHVLMVIFLFQRSDGVSVFESINMNWFLGTPAQLRDEDSFCKHNVKSLLLFMICFLENAIKAARLEALARSVPGVNIFCQCFTNFFNWSESSASSIVGHSSKPIVINTKVII